MHVPIVASKLKQQGHDVIAVCHPDGKIGHEMSVRGVKTLTAPIGGYFNPRQTLRLYNILKSERPDILHLHLSRDLWQIVPAAVCAGTGTLILTKHVGSYVNKRDPLHRYLYSHVKRVITVSEVLRKNVIETCAIPSERVTTIHHALDLDRYDPKMYCRKAVLSELGIPDQDTVVGTVGRVSPGKGLETFLRSAKRVLAVDSKRRFRFLIVGDASFGEEAYFRSIRDLTVSLGLTDQVVFTGFRTDIPALLNAMDVFIFPSHAEGLGATLIEAMAMGVPSVSSNSDGTLDIIEDGITGYTVPPEDDSAMANSVLRILEDSETRQRIAAAGRNQAREKFDLDVMIRKIEIVYAECLAGE